MPRSARKYRFALVTHSTEIVEAVRGAVDPDEEELVTEIVDLDQAVPAARRLLDRGTEVIIGHGGTGALIAQDLGRPVVHIPTTYLSLVRTVLKAAVHGRKIGVTSFAGPRDGIDLLTSHFRVQIRQIPFGTTAELEAGVESAVSEGFPLIVGGGVSRRMAEAQGGRGFVITPEPRNVKRALAQARSMAAAGRREKEQFQQFRTILEMIPDGVIGIDNYGRLHFFNKTAEQILGRPLAGQVGQSLTRFSRDLGLIDVLSTGRPKPEQIRTLFGKNLIIDSLPVTIDGKIRGAVSLIKEAGSIQNIDRRVRESLYQKGFAAKHGLDAIRGSSPAIVSLKERAERYAASDAPIRIHGETGTGKELLAHSLHRLSPRSGGPFVAINCAALPENLLESELFGYEEGAFTGAKKGGKIGLFELAQGGTVFLDEIGDIPPAVQVRLLRTIESKEVMRIGGDRIVPVDVRVVSSTFKDLGEEMRQGRFRPDLYYRLGMLTLVVPPLRHRTEDIPEIIEDLLHRHGKNTHALSRGIVAQMHAHRWPGNVRQLRSLMESYLLLLGEKRYDDALFFDLMRSSDGASRPEAPLEPASTGDSAGKTGTLKERLRRYEARVIEETLAQCRYHRKEAARKLGISNNTLWRKQKETKER